MTFLLDFLGCKVNDYEVNAVGELLLEEGYEAFDSKKDLAPSVIIINTCAVTETSVAKDRKMIRQYRREYPEAILVVMGCYSQYGGKFILDELNADIVLGTSNRHLIPKYIEQFKKINEKIFIHDENNDIKIYENLKLSSHFSKTRAYLKIQDGCNNFCSYCLIPYVRGRSRSRKKEDVLEEISILIENGFKEIVLTGIDMCSYGEDIYSNYRFSDLLEDILVNFPNLYRLRISSIEESQIDEKFLHLLKTYENFANHLHIPLQSGSKKVLQRMNRKYDLENYKKLIKTIREIRSDISITTDLIVGFPEESDKEFEETYNFCKEIEFSKIHCFPYSLRKGTKAASLKQVKDEVKTARMKIMLELNESLEKKYKENFVGKDLDVLFERKIKNSNTYKGYTSNYLEITYTSEKDLKNINEIIHITKENLTV